MSVFQPNALRGQHENFVGQTIDRRTDNGTFGRHEQPTGKKWQPKPKYRTLTHTPVECNILLIIQATWLSKLVSYVESSATVRPPAVLVVGG